MAPANTPASHDARALLRIPVLLESAVCEIRSGRRKVMLTDISSDGCRIDVPFGWAAGRHVTITLPTLSPLGATVRWSSPDAVGLAFDRAVHGTVIQHIIQTANRART